MHLGLLQCGPTDTALDIAHGGYPELYAALFGDGFDWTTWRVFDGDLPDGPDAAEGWVVSGSRHGAYEAHDWIAPLEALIREIHASDLPLVGICFGHQIVAQALGGRVEKFEGGWSVGRRGYSIDGQVRHLNAWHQDQVVAPPEGARIIASNDFTRYAGLAIGDRTLTLQPHPEFPSGYIESLIEARSDSGVPPEMLAQAREDLTLDIDNDAIGAWLADFMRSGRSAT
ncbi:type 1 glutamine amidotransferase [Palleronia sp. LCG004]|uniref:type 1 glutamine amidotransferase n=1 Tax=Palleronia sp. LCG004 TaxID=3079304 RepID=UPI002943ED4A|nr:type 1 glutamine amidotransferase [Palleronia sp. LCG004]WOI57348.1 type 1 glutamine amidotransferase [Palleronia sp. LCG004]